MKSNHIADVDKNASRNMLNRINQIVHPQEHYMHTFTLQPLPQPQNVPARVIPPPVDTIKQPPPPQVKIHPPQQLFQSSRPQPTFHSGKIAEDRTTRNQMPYPSPTTKIPVRQPPPVQNVRELRSPPPTSYSIPPANTISYTNTDHLHAKFPYSPHLPVRDNMNLTPNLQPKVPNNMHSPLHTSPSVPITAFSINPSVKNSSPVNLNPNVHPTFDIGSILHRHDNRIHSPLREYELIELDHEDREEIDLSANSQPDEVNLIEDPSLLFSSPCSAGIITPGKDAKMVLRPCVSCGNMIETDTLLFEKYNAHLDICLNKSEISQIQPTDPTEYRRGSRFSVYSINMLFLDFLIIFIAKSSWINPNQKENVRFVWKILILKAVSQQTNFLDCL